MAYVTTNKLMRRMAADIQAALDGLNLTTQDFADTLGIDLERARNFVQYGVDVKRSIFRDVCDHLGLDWEVYVHHETND